MLKTLQTYPLLTSRVLYFIIESFDIVSDFDIRYSNFIHSVIILEGPFLSNLNNKEANHGQRLYG